MNVGLFFGSFNPIHIGHLIIANYMVEFTYLDQVWFVVSPHNPFKKKKNLLNEYDRLYLVDLATYKSTNLQPCNIEFNMPQPSYTSDTLVYLKEKHPSHTFNLIMGSDNLEGFKKWKNSEEILDKNKILVYKRPGHSGGELKDHPSVTLHDVPLLHISASFIRKAIKEGKSVRYFVPDSVYDYIKDMHLYR